MTNKKITISNELKEKLLEINKKYSEILEQKRDGMTGDEYKKMMNDFDNFESGENSPELKILTIEAIVSDQQFEYTREDEEVPAHCYSEYTKNEAIKDISEFGEFSRSQSIRRGWVQIKELCDRASRFSTLVNIAQNLENLRAL